MFLPSSKRYVAVLQNCSQFCAVIILIHRCFKILVQEKVTKSLTTVFGGGGLLFFVLYDPYHL